MDLSAAPYFTESGKKTLTLIRLFGTQDTFLSTLLDLKRMELKQACVLSMSSFSAERHNDFW